MKTERRSRVDEEAAGSGPGLRRGGVASGDGRGPAGNMPEDGVLAVDPVAAVHRDEKLATVGVLGARVVRAGRSCLPRHRYAF
jgi:hypothetical protein